MKYETVHSRQIIHLRNRTEFNRIGFTARIFPPPKNFSYISKNMEFVKLELS
jgi:hypothetical protein